jgi:NitT/TauT family transport system substrate-binding protein
MKIWLQATVAALVLIGGAMAANPARAESVTVGLSKLFGASAIPIGLERGYFAAQGLDVKMVFFDSAQPIAVGVASGDLDFGIAGMSASFYTLAAQGQLRLLGTSSSEAPGFHALAYLASNASHDAGLTTAKDFAGHTIAITQVGTGLHYAIGLAAEKYGFPMSAVTVRPLQSNSNVIAALAGNTVDAAVLPSGPAIAAEQSGKAKLIGWVSNVGVEWTTGSAIFTSTKVADGNADMVKRFLAAYRRGMNDMHDAFAGRDGKREDGPDQPAVLAIIARFTGLAPNAILRGVAYSVKDGRISADDVDREISWFRSQNLLKGDINAKALIDMRYALPLAAID